MLAHIQIINDSTYSSISTVVGGSGSVRPFYWSRAAQLHHQDFHRCPDLETGLTVEHCDSALLYFMNCIHLPDNTRQVIVPEPMISPDYGYFSRKRLTSQCTTRDKDNDLLSSFVS